MDSIEVDSNNISSFTVPSQICRRTCLNQIEDALQKRPESLAFFIGARSDLQARIFLFITIF